MHAHTQLTTFEDPLTCEFQSLEVLIANVSAYRAHLKQMMMVLSERTVTTSFTKVNKVLHHQKEYRIAWKLSEM